jgi:hypothetical protein
MNKLKWSDQDMVDFANWVSGITINHQELSEFEEDRRKKLIDNRIENIKKILYGVDEDKLEEIENFVYLNTQSSI